MSPTHSPVRVMLRTAAFAACLSSWIGAQMPAERVPADPASLAAEPSKDGTFGVPFDISGGTIGFGESDGSLVGVGDHYKTFFEAGGITFTPALGRAVPTNQNLRLRLESVVRGERVVHPASLDVQPRRSDDAILYERGEITERYDLRPDGIEQSFVFASQPAGSGDLIVRLQVETELEALSGQELESLRFFAGEFGGVDVGAVVGIDAKGRRQEGHLNYTGTHLELVLPAEFVSSAAYPLVLDPPISPRINVTATPVGSSRPEAAYLGDTYLVVWEHAYSASDTDIYGQRVDTCGRLLGGLIVIDAATTDEREPAVAMVWIRGRFVVAYQRGRNGSRDILARTVDYRSGSLGPILLAAGGIDDQYEPAVGGSANTSDNQVILVWADDRLGLRIGAFLVLPNGSLGLIQGFVLDSDPNARRPVICKSGGASGLFLVAWETRNGDWIGARFVASDATPRSAFGYVATGGRSPLLPSVDGFGATFVLSYARQEIPGSNNNFDVWFIDPQPPANPNNVWTFTHSVPIENSQGDDDLGSAIAMINGRSVVAIEDRVGGVGTAYEMWASARNSAGALNGSWHRISEANATTMNKHPSVVARQSGPSSSSDALFVWTCTPSGAISTVKGMLYTETSTPGSSTAFPTGCGGLGIRVSSGSPVIGSNLGWQLTGMAGFASMWIGLSQVAVPLCSNCTLGTPPDITFSGPTIGPLSIPLDPCLIGLEFFTQGADFLGPGACAPLQLRVSDTLRTRIGG